MAFSSRAHNAPDDPPRDIYAPLDGKAVAITNVTGAFRYCHPCGNETAKISTTPVGAHQGALHCTKCGRVTAFLGRDHLAAMLAAHEAEATA